MKTCVLYLFTFFSIFGPKIGYLDLAVIVPALLLPLIISKVNFKPIQHWVNTVYFGIFVLSIVLMVSQIINNNLEVNDNLRLARSLFVVPLIILAFRGESADDIIKVAFYVLLVHSVLIIIAANFNFINEICSLLSGNDRIKDGRASGLVAGFDMAGILLLFALCLIVFDIINFNINTKLLYFIILLIGVFYTSRVNMAFGLCLSFIWFCRTLKSGQYGLLHKISFSLISIIAIIALVKKLIIIIDVTFNLGLNLFNSLESAESITSVHAVQSEDSFLWSDMYLLPDTIGGLIWGTGQDLIISDVGYVKEIFRYGFVGLFVSIAVHYIVIIGPLRAIKSNDVCRNIISFQYVIFILILLYNLKNNYFFTRGVWPLYFMFGLAVYKIADKNHSYLSVDQRK